MLGAITMKAFIKISIITKSFLITALVFSVNIFAAQNTTQNVDVKCFVELVGGGELISFWTAPKNKLKKLAKNIVGKSVMTSSAKNKKIIYKVYECVLLTKKFKGDKARQLDEETPR